MPNLCQISLRLRYPPRVDAVSVLSLLAPVPYEYLALNSHLI